LNKSAWEKFCVTRDRFKSAVKELDKSLPDLRKMQQKLADSRASSPNATYVVKTPVVYNEALDDVTKDDDIKLILTADNPGRREQESRRYLIGPSGKIARNFFINNPSLGIDFTKNVIILNKTPVHTPRTVELRELLRMNSGGKRNTEKIAETLAEALKKSQKIMASILLEFHETLCCPVWITGYSEMRKNGVFETYTDELTSIYNDKKELFKQLFIFRHFSMNQFTIDLRQQAREGESVKKSLERIGKTYREKILG